MPDLNTYYRDRSEHWFADACRKAELLGGIEAWANFPLERPAHGIRITPAKAIAEIRRLLAAYHAEAQSVDGGDSDA